MNVERITVINNLKISLNIEYSKYVHLKISDKDNKRWEVPKEILNQEYFNNSMGIDDEFIHKTFSQALILTSNVVKHVGARGHIYEKTFGNSDLKNNEDDREQL